VTFDRLGVEPEISSTITDAAPETPHCSAEPPAGRRASLYWPVAGRAGLIPLTFFSHLCETHLPAERSTPEAPARIPRADVDPRRPRDSQAPPRQGAQASLGL